MRASKVLLGLLPLLVSFSCSRDSEAEEDFQEPETFDEEAPKRAKGKADRRGDKAKGRGGRAAGNVLDRAPANANAPDMSAVAKSDAAVETTDDRIVTRLATSKCFHVTATPLLVDEYLMFGVHKKGAKSAKFAGCDEDTTPSAIYAVSAKTGEAWEIGPGLDAEATGSWGDGALWVPLVKGGGVAVWDGGATASVVKPLRAATDSAGLYDSVRDQFVFGSVNSPMPVCQKGPQADCGAVVALDRNGKVVHTANRTSGLRGWIAAGPTGDADHYYVGTGSGKDGEASLAGNPMGACSLVRLTSELVVDGHYDDGAEGCVALGRVESAVVGEAPIVDGHLWLQYLGSTDGTPNVPVVRLRASDMKPVCRALIPGPRDRSVASFYQAPVVDEANNAYVTTVNTANGRRASLYKISSTCEVTLLKHASAERVGTPTLADDKWVLFGDEGSLLVVDRDTGKTTTHALGSNAGVMGGAVVSEWGVSVVSVDGTVTTLKKTGISGYGKAPWPRFRRTNLGEAFEP